MEHEGWQAPLYRLIAEQLTKRYRPDVSLSPAAELDQVARAYLKRDPRASVSDLYCPIRDFLKGLPTQAPAPFTHLTQVWQLNLLVSMTFDGLMVQSTSYATRDVEYAKNHEPLQDYQYDRLESRFQESR